MTWTDAAAADVVYEPPVDGPVVDPFRPPAHFAGPGNRGLEYRPDPGAAVLAAADGVVVFAGPVGGDLHVTVLHDDGIRTSYSYLDAVAVAVGDQVTRGSTLAVSGPVLHFGARVGDDYIDPESLFGVRRARLVGVGAASTVAVRTPGATDPTVGRTAANVSAALVAAVRTVTDLAGDRLPAWSR